MELKPQASCASHFLEPKVIQFRIFLTSSFRAIFKIFRLPQFSLNWRPFQYKVALAYHVLLRHQIGKLAPFKLSGMFH
jgi:hypothetical protein